MPIGINPIQAGVSLVPELYKVGLAIKQNREAKKLGEVERPIYYRPGEIREATQLARDAYRDPRLPGQAMMEQRIDSNTANTLARGREVASGPNALMALLSGASSSAQRAGSDLSIEAARQQERDRQDLQRQLGIEGQYSDKEFEYNQNQPYQSAMATKSALSEASNRNLMSALQGATGIANAMDLTQLKRKAPQEGTGYGDSIFNQDELDKMREATSVPQNPIQVTPLSRQIPPLYNAAYMPQREMFPPDLYR